MNNPLDRFNLLVIAAALGAGLIPAVRATAIYSTLGPGNTFDTNAFVHFGTSPILAGPGAYADEFTSPVTVTVGSVSLALEATAGSIIGGPAVNVAIHSNTPAGPGGILGTFTAQVIPAEPSILTFESATGVHLVAGTEYWLSAGLPSPTGGADWFLNNEGIDNVTANRRSGIWTVNASSTALAFSVNPIPEPASVALCTLAIAAAYLWRKRD